MNSENKKIFIGVAWPYVNGDIHVGHLAGYLLPCDIFARWSRLRGYKTLMVSGTDCHGTPITVAADKKGVTPQEIVEEYDPKVRELIKLYGTSYNLFTSTTTINHKKVTQEVFVNLLNNGFIFKQKSEQYYSETENKFLPDRYVEGECPYCHVKDQRADQCENCGRSLGMGELINPKSKLTGSEVILKETEHYFLDYPKLQQELNTYVKQSTNWRTWVRNETLGWLEEGLQPRAITRDLDWGVEIPLDQIPDNLKLDGAQHKRFYVWFDAVIGYLSAAIEWAASTGEDWREFWINPQAQHYYFMGKDNLTFHTLFWPGQIIGQQKNYNLPSFPSVNQFLNLEGKKFSKSRGVHIDSIKVAEHFGVDLVRFYISSILPESKDANWKWDDFRDTINSELCGNFGNFVHRTLIFYKNKLDTHITSEVQLDLEVQKEIQETFSEVNAHQEKCEQVAALNRIMKLSKFGNQYFDQKKPWVALKDNKEESEMTIYNCLQIVYSLTVLLSPYIPMSMEKLDSVLGIQELFPEVTVDKHNFKQLDITKLHLSETIEPLFRKIEQEEIESFLQQKNI